MTTIQRPVLGPPRDLVGYNGKPPKVTWPGNARVATGSLARVRGDLVAKALEQRAHGRGELLAVADVVGLGQWRAGGAPCRHHGVETSVIDSFLDPVTELRVDQAQKIATRTRRRAKRHQ